MMKGEQSVLDDLRDKGNIYIFVWGKNFGMPLQIPKGALVEVLKFGPKMRSTLVRWNGKLFITDRYALRKI